GGEREENGDTRNAGSWPQPRPTCGGVGYPWTAAGARTLVRRSVNRQTEPRNVPTRCPPPRSCGINPALRCSVRERRFRTTPPRPLERTLEVTRRPLHPLDGAWYDLSR